MAATVTGSMGATASPSQVLGSDTVDRMVFIYVSGQCQQYVAFSSANVGTTGNPSGFIIPEAGRQFKLQAGDELWINGLTNNYPRSAWVSYLVTKV